MAIEPYQWRKNHIRTLRDTDQILIGGQFVAAKGYDIQS
jgi:hypothetical protein